MNFDADYQMLSTGSWSVPIGIPGIESCHQARDCESAGGEEQLAFCVAAARRAFEQWSKSSVSQRSATLNATAQALEDHAGEFMRMLTKEQGKPRA